LVGDIPQFIAGVLAVRPLKAPFGDLPHCGSDGGGSAIDAYHVTLHASGTSSGTRTFPGNSTARPMVSIAAAVSRAPTHAPHTIPAATPVANPAIHLVMRSLNRGV
jgi:hypothetical protein